MAAVPGRRWGCRGPATTPEPGAAGSLPRGVGGCPGARGHLAQRGAGHGAAGGFPRDPSSRAPLACSRSAAGSPPRASPAVAGGTGTLLAQSCARQGEGTPVSSTATALAARTHRNSPRARGRSVDTGKPHILGSDTAGGSRCLQRCSSLLPCPTVLCPMGRGSQFPAEPPLPREVPATGGKVKEQLPGHRMQPLPPPPINIPSETPHSPGTWRRQRCRSTSHPRRHPLPHTLGCPRQPMVRGSPIPRPGPGQLERAAPPSPGQPCHLGQSQALGWAPPLHDPQDPIPLLPMGPTAAPKSPGWGGGWQGAGTPYAARGGGGAAGSSCCSTASGAWPPQA